MGFYAGRVFPHLMNAVMDNAENRRTRARVCAPLRGEVIEIGFGTGHNLPFVPDSVTRLRVVEPSAVGVRLAGKRLAASAVPVEISGLDGQALPFDDASADAALSTWTLCSIPDAVAAVREIRRVLRPGGTLHFVEHGLAPDADVRRWQHRLDGIQQRIGAGCHLDRDIPAILEAGGMRIRSLEKFYGRGEPRVFGSRYEGVAAA